MILQIQIGVDDNANESELQEKIYEFFSNINGVHDIVIGQYILWDVWENILERDKNENVFVNDKRKEQK